MEIYSTPLVRLFFLIEGEDDLWTMTNTFGRVVLGRLENFC